MVFADLIFIYIFLPLNLIVYYQTENRSYRNCVIIFFSLFFYAWGEPVWIMLLVFSATIDYFHGLIIEKYRGGTGAKLAVISSLVLNLGLLILFKYSGFIYENINAIFGLSLTVPAFTLPIGISFYTFQTISYTVDVYREKAEVQHSYLGFLMYVSLYFQLVAGPIVRYADVSNEINNRKESILGISTGLTRFCVGLSKKVLVANVAGSLAAPYLDGSIVSLTVFGAWYGAVLFSIQLYYDFSGYSDMAIGLGRMFGFNFLENFNYPYISKSITEFWRRWHISLGNFFRDYLYFPLGGSRKHKLRNIFIVWLATGLWHGASWNFIIWGMYFFVLLLIEKFILFKIPLKLPVIFSHIYIAITIPISWIIFYFTDINKLWEYLKVMLGASQAEFFNIANKIDLFNNVFWLILAIIFIMPVTIWFKDWCDKRSAKIQAVISYATPLFNLLLLFLCTAMLVGQSYNPFLYYRF